MVGKKNSLDLTYDVDGEAAVQQLVNESYHAGYINQYQPVEEGLEQE
jgi:hypothetical protein